MVMPSTTTVASAATPTSTTLTQMKKFPVQYVINRERYYSDMDVEEEHTFADVRNMVLEKKLLGECKSFQIIVVGEYSNRCDFLKVKQEGRKRVWDVIAQEPIDVHLVSHTNIEGWPPFGNKSPKATPPQRSPRNQLPRLRPRQHSPSRTSHVKKRVTESSKKTRSQT